jgi:hypothetical protein
MSPRTLLLKLLRRCGLSAPDGRLLCLYRCTDEEFRELTGVLRDAAHVHWQIWPTQERACLPMCFCLYAAEWWRRNYESGPWAWHDLLEASGLGATIPRQRLYRIVHRGLTGWKRQMLSVAGQRAFLVTLACEGGVPLKLLHRDGTHLHRYFRRPSATRARPSQISIVMIPIGGSAFPSWSPMRRHERYSIIWSEMPRH